LPAYGFSEEMQARFFRPFLGGVFLEQALSTPGWIFELVWAPFPVGRWRSRETGWGPSPTNLPPLCLQGRFGWVVP
jgi:hypothetical protein